ACDARFTRVAHPRRAISEERARVDRRGHVGELRLGELEIAERLPKEAPPPGVRERFVERAARKAERRGGDRGAEDIQVAHRELEALARLAKELGPRAAILD